MNEKHEILRGKEAQMVLDNEAFKSAMSQLKGAVIQNWRDCPIRDREGQLLLLQLAKLTDKFESLLVGMIETGKLAQHRLDLDNIREETKVRQFFRKYG